MLLLLAVGTAYVGSGACSSCHPAQFRNYSKTGMSRSSGQIRTEHPKGTLRHAPSSMVYAINLRAGLPFLEYSRGADKRLNGHQEIVAFIGSGAIGQSYLFKVEDRWFLAPVSYYS